jgi:hypothetical protein
LNEQEKNLMENRKGHFFWKCEGNIFMLAKIVAIKCRNEMIGGLVFRTHEKLKLAVLVRLLLKSVSRVFNR